MNILIKILFIWAFTGVSLPAGLGAADNFAAARKAGEFKPRAWITNGFHTIEITGKEFPALGAIPDR